MSADYDIYETSCCVGAGDGGYDIGAHGVGCFHTANVVFYDNFSDQDAHGWVEENSGMGLWHVIDGVYRGDASLATPGFVRSTVETLLVDDFYYDVEIEPLSPSGTTHLFFRWTDSLNTYEISLDSVGGSLWKHSTGGGGGPGDTLLAEFECSLAVGQKYPFKILASLGTIRAWYREGPGVSEWIPLFTSYDEEPLPLGTVGLGCEDGMTVEFDNILVAWVVATEVSSRDAGADGERAGEVLARVSPNPFRNSTRISFSLPRRSEVCLSIYDIAGRLVRTVTKGSLPAGHHDYRWDGRDETGSPVSSGVYFWLVDSDAGKTTRKILLTR